MRVAMWAALAVAAAAVPLLTANTYYLYLVMSTAILVVITCGVNVLAGLSGQISLGHAGFYAIGAYTGALAAARGSWSLWTALPLSVAVTAAVGAVLALAALRLSGPYLAMVTIAFGIIVEGALVEWVALTGGPGGIFNIPRPALFGVTLPLARYYWVVVLAAAVALWATRNLSASAWGRAFVAVKDSELAAESLGVSVYAVRTTAFTVSAAFAGAGGCLFAFLNGYLSPDSFTLQTSILFLLVVLFGGLGTLAGPVVGAMALVALPEVLRDLLEYRLILYGSLLLASVYFLPRGVVGAVWPAARHGGGDPGPPSSGAVRADHEAVPAVPAAPGVALATVGVSKSFGGVRALSDVSLSVARGAIHSLIGPNGAGKTTLVNVWSGFYRPDAGTVELAGTRVSGLSPSAIARSGLVRTFQTPQLFEALTVLDNVLVGAAGHRLGSATAALLGLSRADTAARNVALGVLAETGLHALAHAAAGALALGDRRRLEIARALAAGAGVLLLDEPAAGLSAAEIDELDRLLVRLKGRGITVVLIEHHMDLVMAISDRVTVLDEGRVIADGPPATVQRDAAVVRAYLGVG
jgi:ABC-type branched-subunit amino acid transport system ATPase component/ABC-type branched-subunit amino acid transport system permease subunit